MSNYSAPFTHTVLRGLYSLLLLLLLPLLTLLFNKKLKQTDTNLKHRKFSERFGVVPDGVKSGGIHIHCVSVGEINAASSLINEIIALYPNILITLTTSSITGAEHAQKIFNDKVQHVYLPIDLPFFISKFYKQIKPSLVLVTEVEIWPNLLAYCYRHNIHTALINARMTNKSLASYKKLAWLFRPTLRQFDLICAQSTESFNNFLSFGVYKPQVKLSRNMKFDLLPEHSEELKGAQIIEKASFKDRPILLAGSTHSPEEKIVLEVYSRLKKDIPNLALIIVPRHPHRFEEAHQIIKASGVPSKKLTSFSPDNTKLEHIDCLIVDEMGLLKACYSACTLAFVGGSFAKKGGHNALEAAVYAKPIIMGPSCFNNPAICDYLVKQEALKIVDSSDSFYLAARHWLSNAARAEDDGANGARVLLKNAGSVEYTMSVLRPYLSSMSIK